jgi:type VII secretion protein EccB
MPSRREQIQSYQYLMQRVVNAFVSGEADPSMSPTRRLAGAGYASVMVAVLALAVFGVIGLLKHGGNTSWKDNGVVVIEKETGTRYVYREGVLYPVANYASAVLVIGQPATTVTVSRESLVGAARGPLIGIAGAPDALPPASRVLGGAWSVCARDGRDSSGGTTVISQVLVGWTPAGGTRLGESGVLVRDASNQKLYLVWNGHRFAITAKQISALGIDQQPRLLVDGAWLNTVPLGLSITQPTVDGRGQRSTAAKNHLVGEVLSVTGGGNTIAYLVRPADLLPITRVEQALILADEATAAAYPGATPVTKEVQPSEVANIAKAGRPAPSDLDPPAQVPAMTGADAAGAICSTFADGQDGPAFLVDADAPDQDAGITTEGGNPDLAADRVVVPPGSGAVVRAAPSPEDNSGTLFLVTDQGKRFSLPSQAQLAWFGYGSIKPVVLPSYVIARIPAGPGLDPRVAQRPLAG